MKRIFLFSISAALALSVWSFKPLKSFQKNSANNVVMAQTKIVITKMTTLDELEKIKAEMISEGLGFDYSNVAYNDKNEIIAISIKYKDTNNNSGNYSVSSSNPINNIIIIADGSQISIKAEGNSGNQSFIKQGNSKQTAAEMDKAQEENRATMQARRDEMRKEMTERQQSMEERRAKMENDMRKRRDSLRNESPSINQEFSGDLQIIKNSTTDSELQKLAKMYDSENITFSYHNLKRNTSGLITNISITVDNRNGSVSTSTFGNGADAIKNISLGVDGQHTIMKSVE